MDELQHWPMTYEELMERVSGDPNNDEVNHSFFSQNYCECHSNKFSWKEGLSIIIFALSAFLFAIGILIMIPGVVGTITDWPRFLTLFFGNMSLMFLSFAGKVFFSKRAQKKAHEKDKKRRQKNLNLVEVVPKYLKERLEQERNRIIGEQSSFGRLLSKLERVEREVLTFREKYIARQERRNPDRYQIGLERIETRLRSVQESLNLMKIHRAKIEGLIEECNRAFDQLIDPLEEASEVDEFVRLEMRADDLQTQVQGEIIETTLMVAEVFGSVQRQFENIAPRAALPAANNGDVRQGYEDLRELVGRFVEIQVPSLQTLEAEVEVVEEEVHL